MTRLLLAAISTGFSSACRRGAFVALALAIAGPQGTTYAQDALPSRMPVSPDDAALRDAQVVDPPAHISFVEGSVVLERDGRPDTSPASMPLLAGDRLRTREGRAEVLFSDGSTMHLDGGTTVDFQSDEVIRLLAGRVRLNIPGTARTVNYRIDAPTGWVSIDQPGAYRVSIFGAEADAEVELAVVRGAAEIVTDDGRTLLRAGERAVARAGLAPSEPYVFNSAAWDEFDQWSEMRRGERLGATAEYLPEEVQPYAATLVHYGTWRHEPTYGYVWYPRVHTGWRPYYHGRWTRLRPWGWTWIAADPWGWPTHHFGRWGFSAGVWFWIPGRHWGPAWVSWAYAPGYVSWCPLGWNNRPVFYFNVHRSFGGRYYDPWHAWTVVPHRRFGSGFVNVNVVNVTHIDARTRRAFVPRTAGPDVRGYAVPRSGAPIRVAGTRRPQPAGAPAYSATTPRAATPDVGAAFRSRRPQVEPRNGQALPPPAREPRPSTAIRRAPSPAGAPSRRDGSSVVAPGGPDGGAVRRAAPRSGVPVAPPRSTDAPSRRTAPEYRGTPSAPRGNDASPAVPPSRERPRAVPRSGGSDRSASSSQPVPSAQPDYSRRSPGYARPDRSDSPGYGVPRAVPRSSPGEGPRSYRSAPGSGESPRAYGPPSGGDRRAPEARPSARPPSAAPSRPSGSPRSAAPSSNRGGSDGGSVRGGSDGGGSRSRGGQQSSGSAVRRPRG
jgi:hypothetical protein